MEAISGFLIKWLDKPKVEQDQHVLTTYLYAEDTKKSVGSVPKEMYFYEVPFDSGTCNDPVADLQPLHYHHICYYAFDHIHNVGGSNGEASSPPY